LLTASEIEYRVSSTDLVSALTARTPGLGGYDGGWPGLTLYRFIEPMAPSWEEIQSLSLGIVAQGSKAVLVDGERYVYDPFHYLVLSRNLHFQAEILDASAEEPFLSFVLQINPALVRKVAAGIADRALKGLAGLEPADADPSEVARQIVRVIDMPFGKRPFRVHVDPSQDGAEVVNAVADRMRREMYPNIGLEALLSPRHNG